MSLKKLIKSSSLRHILLTSGLIWLLLAGVLWLSQTTVIEYLTSSMEQELEEQANELREFAQSGAMQQELIGEREIPLLEMDSPENEPLDTFLSHYRDLIAREKQTYSSNPWLTSVLEARLFLLGYTENLPAKTFPLNHLTELLIEEIPEHLHGQLEPIVESNMEQFNAHYQWQFDSLTLKKYLLAEGWMEQDYRCFFLQNKNNSLSNMTGDIPESFTGGYEFWWGQIRNEFGQTEPAACLLHQLPLDDQNSLIIGQRVDYLVELIDKLSLMRYWGTAAGLILAILISVIISRRQVNKLSRIHKTCALVEQGQLSQRITVPSPSDDYDKVAISINQMLDRLEKLVTGIKYVSDNIAHDLLSPLTRIRSKLDMLAMDAPQSAEKINHIINEADNLLLVFNTLLRITQLESGSQRQEFRPFNFIDACADMVEFYQPAYESKEIQLEVLYQKDHFNCIGDFNLWSQAISNLLDNALKYTPEGGQVVLRVFSQQGQLVFQLQDSGPGITLTDHEKVQQRFYRLEKNRSSQGNGLGLALVKAIVDLHQARLELSEPPGLTITIKIPL